MAWSATLPLDTSKISLSAGYIRSNQAAIQSVLSFDNLTFARPYIPVTAPVWFYVDTAPVGWTIVALLADSLLAVKGGTSQYNVTGGTGVAAGTWNGPPHTLSAGQIPPHTHTFQNFNATGGSNTASGGSAVATTTVTTSNGSPTLQGLPHSHDWTTTRPQAYVGILCTKNP